RREKSSCRRLNSPINKSSKPSSSSRLKSNSSSGSISTRIRSAWSTLLSRLTTRYGTWSASGKAQVNLLPATMTPICIDKTPSMAIPVFVDTGAHYALADVQDPDYAEAVRLLQQIVRLRYALVTSNFVIFEVYTLLRQRLGWEVAIHYVEELRA